MRFSVTKSTGSDDAGASERAFSVHSRHPPCNMQMQPKYPYFKAKISLPCPFANVHPMIWTSSALFNRALQII